MVLCSVILCFDVILVTISTFSNTTQKYIFGNFGRGAKLQNVEFVYDDLNSFNILIVTVEIIYLLQSNTNRQNYLPIFSDTAAVSKLPFLHL